jgi:hypothetical protein
MTILVALFIGYLLGVFLERRTVKRLERMNCRALVSIAELRDDLEGAIKAHDLAFERYQGVRGAFRRHIETHKCRLVPKEEEWEQPVGGVWEA